MACSALNLLALSAALLAGWRVWRGPESEPLPDFDAARYALADAVRPRDRACQVVSGQLDRPLPPREPPPPAPVPTEPAPGGPRPNLRLLAVLDDPEECRGRAAIVALADGRQRLLLPDGYLEPEGAGGRWRVRRVGVEELAGGVRGVLTLEEGTRVECYDSPLRGTGP
ncbi:MAG: hypothetical protein AB7N76_02855 [Planctomycetota bacterium]